LILTVLNSDYGKYENFQGNYPEGKSEPSKSKIQTPRRQNQMDKFSSEPISALGTEKERHLVVIKQRLIKFVRP
jgi:hypothetical protein